MKKILFLLLVISFCFANSGSCETIVLKSGQVIVGELIEKTDEYIKVDYKGVVLTYYKNEINETPIDPGPIPNNDGVIRIIKKKQKKVVESYDDACLGNVKSQVISKYQRCQCRIFPELEKVQNQYNIGIKPVALEDSGGEFQECAAYLYWLDENKPESKESCEKRKKEISNNLRNKNLPFFIIREGLNCE